MIQSLLKYLYQSNTPLPSVVTLIINNSTCTDVLFNDNFLDPYCLKLSISKSIGYVMILGACLYKLPVILKIIKKKGGDGINIYSYYLETAAYLSTLAYNYYNNNPISTYGDLILSVTQNIIIISMIWLWGMNGKKVSSRHIAIIALIVALYISFIKLPTEAHVNYILTTANYIKDSIVSNKTISVSNLLSIDYTKIISPEEHKNYVYRFAVMGLLLSRLPQIVSNFRTGNIGVQSSITQLNAVLGAAAKVFTSIVEAPTLLPANILALVLNSVLFLQVYFYRSSSDTTTDSHRNTATVDSNSSNGTVKGNKKVKSK